jgi:hypothetical protein
MKVDHLYAVFGSYKELGDRPYWLLWCIQLPYQAPKAPNNLKAQDGSTIRGGTWIFDAYFFESTSADQQRRSYKLLDGEKVHVTVESLIQEADLEFDRDGDARSHPWGLIAPQDHASQFLECCDVKRLLSPLRNFSWMLVLNRCC